MLYEDLVFPSPESGVSFKLFDNDGIPNSVYEEFPSPESGVSFKLYPKVGLLHSDITSFRPLKAGLVSNQHCIYVR